MNNTLRKSSVKRVVVSTIVGAMLMQTVGPAHAVVSQLPGLYTAPPDVNVMFTFDDSLSMPWETIPDDGDGVGETMWSSTWNSTAARDKFRLSSQVWRFYRSSAGNPIYYNPQVRYQPWPSAANDQVTMPQAVPTAACKVDDVLPATLPTCGAGTARDLATRVVTNSPDNANKDDETRGYWPATYFNYTGTTPLVANGAANGGTNATYNSAANFTKVEIRPTLPGSTTAATYPKVAARTDCTGAIGPTGCTYAQEIQNFANWFQYYRTRALMGKGASAIAFSRQGTNLRVGLGIINQGSKTVDGVNSPGTVVLGVRKFETTNRTAFYNGFYSEPTQTAATPLRKAANQIGQYFQRTDSLGPWGINPGTGTEPTSTHLSCRRSFHILTTDGLWRSDNSGLLSGNQDNFSGTTPAKPDGTTYTYSDTATSPADPLVARFGINPFTDTHSQTLADAAAYYWKSDLRPDLANRVVPSTRDPAFWQHLTTFTVGMGINGTLALTQAQLDTAVANRTAIAWPAPGDNSIYNGDDLVHASVNGRGRYFAATNPSDMATQLAAALAEATGDPGSLANVVTSSPSVSAGTAVYQATYTPGQWSGRFYAFNQSADGSVNTTPGSEGWEASNKMPAPTNRNIFTWNPTSSAGSTFTWAGLTAAQQGFLANDSTLLAYLRGDDAKEVANGGPFRDRARYTVGAVKGGVLGDIVNGSPIKGPSAGSGYERMPPGTPGQASYAAFRSTGNTALDNMRNTMFLGANDGMLHAFDRITGVERFAYVPNAVFSVPRSLTGTEAKLRMLSDPGYTHRYTVDGPPQIGDAFIGPNAAASTWKTVLLGSTGAGARAVFAMDITNPAVVAGGFDQTKLLWEFSEANHADMGYVISYPHIARMRDGTWVAIFGNGYDSVNGQAKLFILNLQTGAVVWERGVGAPGGNGLSQPNFTVNDKREVTAIYAGDLKGNLWKFDMDNADPTQWKVAFGGAPNYTPLFAGSANQPISVMPEITYHPNGGVLVSFGTGKLFENEDTAATLPPNINRNIQAIYGIWDKPGEITGFSGNTSLVQQGANTSLAAVADTTLSGTTSLTIDWTTKRGWYLDLASGGERVNVNPQQAKSTLLVVTNTPSIDPCNNGGSSRIFALDPITGGAPIFGVLDANGSGTITNADKGYNVKAISFAVLSLPALQTKKTTTNQIVTERVGTRGQTGERLGGVEKKPTTPTDCAQWLLAGGSDTSIAGFDISLCAPGKPRISWRQLQ